MSVQQPQISDVEEWPEERIQTDLDEIERAKAVAGPEPAVRTDGSGEEPGAQGGNQQLRMAEDESMTDTTDIKPGDVALDLAQGRPVHILEDTGQTALDWSNENGYDLLDNYANERFETTASDRVFNVVYCGSVKSEPTKTYAFPESRLMRIETEAADGGRQVYDRIVVDVLERLFQRAGRDDQGAVEVLETYATDADVDADAVDEARELAEAAQFGGDA